MKQKEVYDVQHCIETLRQVMRYNFWYELRLDFKSSGVHQEIGDRLKASLTCMTVQIAFSTQKLCPSYQICNHAPFCTCHNKLHGVIHTFIIPSASLTNTHLFCLQLQNERGFRSIKNWMGSTVHWRRQGCYWSSTCSDINTCTHNHSNT